ncbi:MAG: hypothetical protein KC478_12960 [Bacteriovoracaceae bacterium]|nr:hypothetical protein [Bacteriovoracaceae bacterium]
MARFNVEPNYKKYWGSFTRGDQKGNISGESTGLNVGYIGNYFLAGLSFELGNFKYSKSITDDNYTLFKGGGVGTYMGFHFFDRVKLWTGYLNSSIEPKGNDDFQYFGQQVSFGLGIRIWKYILLNYEVYNNYFTQVESDVTGKTEGLDTNIRTKKESIGLSAFFIF